MGGVPVAPFESPIPLSMSSEYENVTSMARDFLLDAASLLSQHINLKEIQAISPGSLLGAARFSQRGEVPRFSVNLFSYRWVGRAFQASESFLQRLFQSPMSRR